MKFGGIFFKIFQSLVGEVWGEIALYLFFCYLVWQKFKSSQLIWNLGDFFLAIYSVAKVKAVSEFGSSDVFFRFGAS